MQNTKGKQSCHRRFNNRAKENLENGWLHGQDLEIASQLVWEFSYIDTHPSNDSGY